jgi:predicted nucleic acid-binding protein
MTIVSNASPLINLARIGKLDLLRELYGELIIPQAVWQEVVLDGVGQPGAEQVKTSDWIKAQSIKDERLAQALRQELDAGEAEAIVLAIETEAELLLMDEHLGREIARHLGVRYIGLIGVLREAKRKRLIPTIKPYLDALRDLAGFRISDRLYWRVLQDEGEV